MAILFAWKLNNGAKYSKQINNLVEVIIFCRPYLYQSNKKNNILQLYLCNIYSTEYLWVVYEV